MQSRRGRLPFRPEEAGGAGFPVQVHLPVQAQGGLVLGVESSLLGVLLALPYVGGDVTRID